MKTRECLLLLLIGVLLGAHASPAYRPEMAGTNIVACLHRKCNMDSGPVCAIDDTGFPRTFENSCWADLASCREGTYYAVMKPGEC